MRGYKHSSQMVKYTWQFAGDLLIPAFQRAYVWTADERMALCRSLVDGIPLGQVVVWSERPGEDQYIIDGQQRLTTIARISDETEIDPTFRLGLRISDFEIVQDAHISVDIIPFHTVLNSSLGGIHEWHTLAKNSGMDDFEMRSVYQVIDRLSDATFGVLVIRGSLTYARAIYKQLNSWGVRNDCLPDPTRDGSISLSDQVRRLRA